MTTTTTTTLMDFDTKEINLVHIKNIDKQTRLRNLKRKPMYNVLSMSLHSQGIFGFTG